MPDEYYDFKPTADVRSFGQLSRGSRKAERLIKELIPLQNRTTVAMF
jgi:hypothetical protein